MRPPLKKCIYHMFSGVCVVRRSKVVRSVVRSKVVRSVARRSNIFCEVILWIKKINLGIEALFHLAVPKFSVTLENKNQHVLKIDMWCMKYIV